MATQTQPFRLISFAFAVFLALTSPPVTASSTDVSDAVRRFEAGDTVSARRSFEEILDEHPDHAAAHLYLGRIALGESDRDTAKDHLEKAVDLADSSEAHLWYGRALLDELQKANMFAKAAIAPRVRRAFETAVERDPENVDARSQLGHFYLNAPAIGGGSKAKARQQAEAIIPLDPAQGHAFLARVLASSSDAEGAVRAYRAALDHDPENTSLLYQLGMAYQAAKQWDEAFATFERVVHLDPEHQHAIYQYGRTGALSGHNLERCAQTLERFAREIAEEGTSYYASVHWRLGMIREHQGNAEAARQCYERALERDPDLSAAREALRELERSGPGRQGSPTE